MNKFVKRYCIDAMSGMAQGLFASLLIGTIIKTLGQQLLRLVTNPVFDFLVTKARIGFDFTDSIPFFGSPSNGGKINVLGSDFDFSGGTLTFSPQWTKEFSMPYYEISFSKLS